MMSSKRILACQTLATALVFSLWQPKAQAVSLNAPGDQKKADPPVPSLELQGPLFGNIEATPTRQPFDLENLRPDREQGVIIDPETVSQAEVSVGQTPPSSNKGANIVNKIMDDDQTANEIGNSAGLATRHPRPSYGPSYDDFYYEDESSYVDPYALVYEDPHYDEYDYPDYPDNYGPPHGYSDYGDSSHPYYYDDHCDCDCNSCGCNSCGGGCSDYDKYYDQCGVLECPNLCPVKILDTGSRFGGQAFAPLVVEEQNINMIATSTGAAQAQDNSYNEVLAHNQCGCGVSCKKQCGSGCCTKKFKIHGCITVDEEIERCEKSGEKSCNDGRFYKTMECAHQVDSQQAQNDFDFVDDSQPIFFEEGMSYFAGDAPADAPADDESTVPPTKPAASAIITPTPAQVPDAAPKAEELAVDKLAPPKGLMKRMGASPVPMP